jgi:hypothetical protein
LSANNINSDYLVSSWNTVCLIYIDMTSLLKLQACIYSI